MLTVESVQLSATRIILLGGRRCSFRDVTVKGRDNSSLFAGMRAVIWIKELPEGFRRLVVETGVKIFFSER
jgi:hypothetical protein